MQNAHVKYAKISTMRKFPAIRYSTVVNREFTLLLRGVAHLVAVKTVRADFDLQMKVLIGYLDT